MSEDHWQSVYLPIHLLKHSCRTPRSRERSYSTDIHRSFPWICKPQITFKDNHLRQRLNISICCRRAAKTSEIPTSGDTPQQAYYCTMEIHPKTCSSVWWFPGTTHWSDQTQPKKVLERANVRLTELQTIVTEIEAILNDRPLTFISSNIDDEQPLTPSHLLYGRRITALPHPLIEEDEWSDPTFNKDPTIVQHLAIKYTISGTVDERII